MRAGDPDAYRRLGLAPGASDAEVKRAYRALAKRFHPDAPGGSVARFLEVQAAYERLLGASPAGGSGTSRSPRRPAQGRGPAGPGSPDGAGSAGAAWARRPGGGSTRRSAGGGAAGDGRGPSGRPGSGTSSRASDAGAGGRARPGARPDSAPTGGSGGSTRPRGRRRATLGSTSYDDAEAVFEPDWEGAAWYGPTSGTYWTLNPKEYADPRKHGPEYQARARRRAAGDDDPAEEAPAGDPDDDGTEGSTAEGAGTADAPADPPGSRERAAPGDDGLPAGWRSATWTAAAPPGAAPPTFEHDPPEDRSPGVAPTEDARGARSPGGTTGAGPVQGPRPAATAGEHRGPAAPPPARRGADHAGPGVGARVVLGLLAWLVPGFSLAAVAGLPGGLAATLPLQLAGVAALALLPRAAWAGIGGGLAVILGAIPIVALTSALTGPVTPGGPAPAGAIALAAGAWLAGAGLVASGRLAPYPWAAPRR